MVEYPLFALYECSVEILNWRIQTKDTQQPRANLIGSSRQNHQEKNPSLWSMAFIHEVTCGEPQWEERTVKWTDSFGWVPRMLLNLVAGYLLKLLLRTASCWNT